MPVKFKLTPSPIYFDAFEVKEILEKKPDDPRFIGKHPSFSETLVVLENGSESIIKTKDIKAGDLVRWEVEKDGYYKFELTDIDSVNFQLERLE